MVGKLNLSTYICLLGTNLYKYKNKLMIVVYSSWRWRLDEV